MGGVFVTASVQCNGRKVGSMKLWKKPKRNYSWIANPSKYQRFLAPLRYYFYGVPLKAMFLALEFLFSGVKKNYVLFVLPLNEYDENTRYMFEHCLASGIRGKKLILFVYPKELYEKLNERYPEHCVYAKSLKGFIRFFQASLALTSRGLLLHAFYPYYFNLRYKTFINMWHGIPLKRIHFLATGGFERVFHQEKTKFSIITVCSKIEQLTMAASFRMGLDDIWITSTPRCDPLFNPKRLGKSKFSKMILYAPTYRDGMGNAKLFPFDDMSVTRLAEFLEHNDCTLIIRRHLFEKGAVQDKESVPNRILIDDRESIYGSLQEELLDADILITDYSSIYLDYLALDRPVVFIPYDQKEYETKRGLMFDYDSVTPGPKVDSLQSLLDVLAEYLRDPKRDSEVRRAVRDMFHEKQDGKAAERLAERITEYAADLTDR